MSDSKKNPKMPPPDDFAKTSPNVDFDDEELADWEKTRVNQPSDAPSDDWGKTVINYNSSRDEEPEDFGHTQYNSNDDPKEPDWGMTRANINLDDDFRGDDDFDVEPDGATVPYFRLPEAERAKYTKLPPTPTEKAKKAEEQKKKSGGIPAWFWVTAGLMTMFSFAVLVLLGAWFFLSGTSGFVVKIKGAQPNSEIFVDGSRWGVTSPGGEETLNGLRAGNRKIIVRSKGFKDDEHQLEGANGETKTIIARQQKAAAEQQGCDKIVDVVTREKCANTILDNLDSPPNIDDLLRALNLYYINFASGQHTIPSERLRFLERASTYIKQLPGTVVIEVGGHTDDVGNDDSNMALSQRRAESVKKVLIEYGVSEAMLVTRGYGETSPKDTNDTDRGRFENRRIAYKAIKR